MNNHLDIGVFVGRMQPFHLGHMAVINEALKKCSFVFIVLGSAHQARSTRNPFTTSERLAMLGACFGNNPRIRVLPVRDSNYNVNAWIERVSDAVANEWRLIQSHNGGQNTSPKIVLFGHNKDWTTSYLDMFPSWTYEEVNNHMALSATDIRDVLFNGDADPKDKHFGDTFAHTARKNAEQFLDSPHATVRLPATTIDFLKAFVGSDDYLVLAQEYAFAYKYKKQWEHAPYAPTFVTVDACCIMSGHVLLVKRKHYPGKGLWAMPGGFLEPYDTIVEGCLRELKEETGIKLPTAVLRGHIVNQKVFDNPFRSSRGRTITHAHLINLGVGTLPKLKKQDEEIEDVSWVPLHSLQSEDFFEDHYQIIRNLLANY